jgi:hypothetical protein
MSGGSASNGLRPESGLPAEVDLRVRDAASSASAEEMDRIVAAYGRVRGLADVVAAAPVEASEWSLER